jgi:DNA-binding MarR family transcriptional regulator
VRCAARALPQPTQASGVGADQCVPRDSVDSLVASWRRAQPDLDFTPVGVVSRLGRVRGHIDAALDAVFAEHGLSAPTFAVLVTLARLNAPDGVQQRRLMDELGLTSGTISVRMDRLVEEELIERRPNPADRRNSLIVLTEKGRSLFHRVVPAHLDNEQRLLVALTEPERETLEMLLRKLLIEYEGTVPTADAQFRLGLTIAPAHVAMAMRLAVGLSPYPGLLVKHVTAGGHAAQGGLQAGDILIRAGRHDLRSIAGLYAAIADASGKGRLKVEILRGTQTENVSLTLPAAPTARDVTHASSMSRAASEEHIV